MRKHFNGDKRHFTAEKINVLSCGLSAPSEPTAIHLIRAQQLVTVAQTTVLANPIHCESKTSQIKVEDGVKAELNFVD